MNVRSEVWKKKSYDALETEGTEISKNEDLVNPLKKMKSRKSAWLNVIKIEFQKKGKNVLVRLLRKLLYILSIYEGNR